MCSYTWHFFVHAGHVVQQLYLGGEFVGGSDIVMEMYQTGELQEAIEVAAAS
jgi:monothiol glutaredoxin